MSCKQQFPLFYSTLCRYKDILLDNDVMVYDPNTIRTNRMDLSFTAKHMSRTPQEGDELVIGCLVSNETSVVELLLIYEYKGIQLRWRCIVTCDDCGTADAMSYDKMTACQVPTSRCTKGIHDMLTSHKCVNHRMKRLKRVKVGATYRMLTDDDLKMVEEFDIIDVYEFVKKDDIIYTSEFDRKP